MTASKPRPARPSRRRRRFALFTNHKPQITNCSSLLVSTCRVTVPEPLPL